MFKQVYLFKLTYTAGRDVTKDRPILRQRGANRGGTPVGNVSLGPGCINVMSRNVNQQRKILLRVCWEDPQPVMTCVAPPPGTLDVRLMGCQDLLESVPGRSKAASVALPGWSPSETRSSFISRANRNRGASARNLAKSEDLSSTPHTLSICLSIYLCICPSISRSIQSIHIF